MKLKWKLAFTISIVLISFAALITLTTYFTARVLLNGKISDQLYNASELGKMLFDCKYPGDWKVIDDKLYKGEVLINDNFELVDEISNKTGILATVFLGDTRVSTNVKGEDEIRKVGTKASKEVAEKTLLAGEKFTGETLVAGFPVITLYTPIKDSSEKVIGMWFVGIPKNDIDKQMAKSTYLVYVILFLMLIVGVMVSVEIQRKENNYKKQLKENQEMLFEKERLSSLGQLIGGIAHNLRTPLMTSSAGIDIIKKHFGIIKEYKGFIDDNIENRFREIEIWAQRIKSNIEYMDNIIITVKDQAANNYVLDRFFSVCEIINKTIALMEYELKKSKCKLELDLKDLENLSINGDINAVIQVLNNLIMNAIEASSGDTKIIYLRVYTKDNNIVFAVENKGEPIPKEVQKNIFKKMITTKGAKGTGLGLYISHLIIKGRLNGKMNFESNEEKTVFYVSIPKRLKLINSVDVLNDTLYTNDDGQYE